MTTKRNQPGTRSRQSAGLRKAQIRSAAASPIYRRSIVALIRGWVRGGRVADPDQVAAALNRLGSRNEAARRAGMETPSSRSCWTRRQICSPSLNVPSGAI